MKKNINIYIVGILALLLLGVNMVTLKKYKALKTYCQEQIADKSITGQKEMALWVNSQIAFSVNGMKMPNILLKEYNGVTIPLEEYMKGRKEVLVVRVNELYCSDCVNFILQKIGRLSKELNLDENILLIGSYQSSTARRYLEKNMKLPSTVFDIENGNLSLPLEEEGFPYCFLLSSDMTKLFLIWQTIILKT